MGSLSYRCAALGKTHKHANKLTTTSHPAPLDLPVHTQPKSIRSYLKKLGLGLEPRLGLIIRKRQIPKLGL
jgi:hypothetical protein